MLGMAEECTQIKNEIESPLSAIMVNFVFVEITKTKKL